MLRNDGTGAMAFAHEVIRQGLKGLTISQCVGAMDADLLVGGGAVDRLIYGGGSLDRFGRLACVNRWYDYASPETPTPAGLSFPDNITGDDNANKRENRGVVAVSPCLPPACSRTPAALRGGTCAS